VRIVVIEGEGDIVYTGKLGNWRMEVKRLAVKTSRWYLRGGYPESVHRLSWFGMSRCRCGWQHFGRGRGGRGGSGASPYMEKP